MKQNPEDILWLLNSVKCNVEETARRKTGTWGSSKHFIFRGSYDVWKSENDGEIYDKIMNARLEEARDLGLIINESNAKEWKYNENWFITEKGRRML